MTSIDEYNTQKKTAMGESKYQDAIFGGIVILIAVAVIIFLIGFAIGKKYGV